MKQTDTERAIKWNKEHPTARHAICKKWRRTHQEQIQTYDKKWRHKTRAARRICRRNYMRKRRKLDPVFAMVERIRKRTRRAIGQKLFTTKCLLDCSPRQFKQHLESLFFPGMSWANRSLWHIDHKRPISSFDLTTEAGQRAAFHYTNCQPLWAVDNLRKGARIAASKTS